MWKPDIPDPRSPWMGFLWTLASSTVVGPYIAAVSRLTVAGPAPAAVAACAGCSLRQS